MWVQSTITILFKGLLCFHKVTKDGCSYYEIGVVPATHHIPRINTIKNSTLADVFPLQEHINPGYPIWRLVVDYPIREGVSVYRNGTDFDRLTHDDELDFRWMSDLESDEFYKRDLTRELDTCPLRPVLHVPYGIFYTRLKSPRLLRKQEGSPEEAFGCMAAVTGCDIAIVGGGARLVEEGTGAEIFSFKAAPATIYEFSNTTPDIEDPDACPHCPCPHHPCPHHQETDTRPNDEPHNDVEAASDPGHFHEYYKLFTDPGGVRKFSFRLPGPPEPSPALCGAVQLGRRQVPLK